MISNPRHGSPPRLMGPQPPRCSTTQESSIRVHRPEPVSPGPSRPGGGHDPGHHAEAAAGLQPRSDAGGGALAPMLSSAGAVLQTFCLLDTSMPIHVDAAAHRDRAPRQPQRRLDMPVERKHSISPTTRRTALKTFAAVTAATVWGGRASAAPEFSFKVATSPPAAHPINVRLAEAAERVREETPGRMELRLFPAGQLGSDPDLIGQVRSGAVDIYNTAPTILSPFVPAVAVANMGFAFER